MEPGYEMEPRPIERSTHRGAWVVVGAVVISMAVAIVKPWSIPAVAPPDAREIPSPMTSPSARTERPVALAQIPAPTWPAASYASAPTWSAASEAEGALRALTDHSGTWGIGNAGVGPRMLRDEPWADWAAVSPEVAANLPLHVATWPDTNLCTGYASIYDRPSIVAVTTPADIAPDWRLVGWWTDGVNAADLAGSVRQVSPAGNRGISYLERTDRAPWPPGRYEFHVIAGGRAFALTVCLTRRG
jgi:hypothetical protein